MWIWNLSLLLVMFFFWVQYFLSCVLFMLLLETLRTWQDKRFFFFFWLCKRKQELFGVFCLPKALLWRLFHCSININFKCGECLILMKEIAPVDVPNLLCLLCLFVSSREMFTSSIFLWVWYFHLVSSCERELFFVDGNTIKALVLLPYTSYCQLSSLHSE